jgi:hypothetical protein
MFSNNKWLILQFSLFIESSSIYNLIIIGNMKIEHHVAVSTLVSVNLYMIFKSWGLSIASLLIGIFIDLD